MVNLLHAPVSSDDSATKPEIAMSDYAVLSQAVLKLSPSPEQPPCAKNRISTSGLVALGQFINLVSQMRSLSQDAAIPPTAEALLPYVQEEAQDLLSALQAGVEAEADPAEPEWQNYFSLSSLTPWLLWGTARTAYGVMRLLEGIPAKVLQPGQVWRSGVLRLVALLELKISGLSYWVDLATHQASPSPLTPASLIHFNDNVLGLSQQPVPVAKLTQRLTEQAQVSTVALSPLINGVQAEILIPHRSWQSGWLQLHFSFEFIPAPVQEEDVEGKDGQTNLLADPIAAPIVKLTHSIWVENYLEAIFQQQLARILAQLPRFQRIEDVNTSPSAQVALALLVRDTCTVADRLQNSLTLDSRRFLQQELGLNDLAIRLLWCFSSSAYEVMQLMSSVHASLLQPNCGWVRGRLRFVTILTVQTPELDWQFDLITGQVSELGITLLAEDAIVQSDEHRWCQQPNLLKLLYVRIEQQLDQAIPQVQQLLEGTEVDLLGSDRQWQPGVLQLNVGFEFIPDSRTLRS